MIRMKKKDFNKLLEPGRLFAPADPPECFEKPFGMDDLMRMRKSFIVLILTLTLLPPFIFLTDTVGSDTEMRTTPKEVEIIEEPSQEKNNIAIYEVYVELLNRTIYLNSERENYRLPDNVNLKLIIGDSESFIELGGYHASRSTKLIEIDSDDDIRIIFSDEEIVNSGHIKIYELKVVKLNYRR